ncbi:MAG: Hsp70 family protein, partial [Myxococcota bacterium]
QIDVTFDIDANGILSVSATDKATNREQSIRIEGSGGLAKDEIDRLVKDAEGHAADDKKRREAIESRNQLDSMIYQAEKTLSENADKIEAEEKTNVEQAVAEAKKDLEGDDRARMDAGRQRVEAALHKVAESLYKAQAPQAGATPEGGGGAREAGDGPGDGPNGKDDVIDAEFTEEKDDH